MTLQADLEQYKTDYMKSALEHFCDNQTNTQSGTELQLNVLKGNKINYYSDMHGVS